MGKQIRLKAEKEREIEEKFVRTFAAHSVKERHKPKPTKHSYLNHNMSLHMHRWLRTFNEWQPKTKSQNPRKRELELLRFLFQKYPVPSFMEDVWFNNNLNQYIPWYLAVAQGESLFKHHAKGILTKKECFFLLKAPNDFDFIQNLWWSKAMALGASVGAANNIARSKLRRQPANLTNEFWYTVVMFFVKYPMSPSKIDDIIDFIMVKRQENPQYSLTGRTPATFEKQLEEWHRLLAKQKTYGEDHWIGRTDLPDWTYIQGKISDSGEDNRIIWSMYQIKNGKDLVKEGAAMHHCVASYRGGCMAGRCSIWSLTKYIPKTLDTKKCLTVELDRCDVVVQARGFANRLARPEERTILHKWLLEHGLNTNLGRN